MNPPDKDDLLPHDEEVRSADFRDEIERSHRTFLEQGSRWNDQ